MTKAKQPDLFVIDLADVAPRDDLASMEHPLFSLTTNPQGRELVYKTANAKLEIVPSGKGLPTIFDKDILIFCISRLMAAKNRGEDISPRVQFSGHDLLLSTRRRTGGAEYARLKDAFSRLQGTQFITDVKTGGEGETSMFSLVDKASFHYDMTGKKMRVKHCEVVLSEWVMRSIEANEVVQIAPEYFDLRRPLERRLYEICRKHCGNQKAWSIGLNKLQVKTGSNAPLKRFRLNLRGIIKADSLPFYRLELDDKDKVTVRPRSVSVEYAADIRLPEWAEEKARVIAQEKGRDYHAMRSDWVSWAQKMTAEGNPPKDAGASFVGYAKKQKKVR